MSAGKAALGACRDAWRQGRVFVGAHLLARLLAYAVIAPLLGGMVNLTVSLSHQSALTDQDIAGFILTPIGFVVTVIALSILLVAEVTAFAMMTAVIRDGDGNGWRAMGRALVLALALVLGAGAVVGQTAGSLARALEMPAQRALQRLRERPDTRLAPFVTDGCSGGLSDGWRLAAAMLPGFAEAEGGQPPWEGCCVIHDHAYHGGAVDADASANYDARLAADRALRACVVQSAVTGIDARAARYGVSPALVRSTFEAIAGAMYHAVRVGGAPCSLLPWRWGYGYPGCNWLARGNGG